jgi:ferredoxin
MPQYKIEIDRDECISCEQCVSDAPGTFGTDDDDKAIVIDPEGDAPDVILAAAQNCPVEAIKLYDTETGAQVWPED